MWNKKVKNMKKHPLDKLIKASKNIKDYYCIIETGIDPLEVYLWDSKDTKSPVCWVSLSGYSFEEAEKLIWEVLDPEEVIEAPM